MNQVLNKIAGANLKKLRLEQNLKIEDIVEIFSISKSAYSRIENGQTNSWSNIIYQASAYYKVDLSYFIYDNNDNYHNGITNSNIEIKKKLLHMQQQLDDIIKIIKT